MKSFYNYKILAEKQISVEYYRGEVNLNVSIASKLNLVKDDQFNPSFDSIVDFRDSNLQFKEEDAKVFIEFMKKQKNKDETKKTAFLTKTPNQVVSLTLFSSFSEKFKLTNKIFSSIDALLTWLEIDKDDFSLIKLELDNLKNTAKPVK